MDKLQKVEDIHQQLRTLSGISEISTDWILDRDIMSIGKDEESWKSIAILIGKMQEALNIDNPMSADMVTECAKEVPNQYPHFKLHDIIAFCNGCKFGRYGRVYNRMNGQILFEWLAEYDRQRLEKIHQKRQEQKSEMIVEQAFVDPEASKRIQELLDKWTEEDQVEPTQEEFSQRQREIAAAKYTAQKIIERESGNENHP